MLITGGVYFTDERIDLLSRYEGEVEGAPWQNVYAGLTDRQDADWLFVVGIKKWVRRLKKAGVKYGKMHKYIGRYLERRFDKRIPLGILDDNNLDDELHMGDKLRKLLFEEFNCKVFLLREYLTTKKYDPRVIPFSIPCRDYYTEEDKLYSMSFYGHKSHKDRKKHTKKLRGTDSSYFKVYTHGEKDKNKLDFNGYRDLIAQSRMALSFAGAGYCCFRYQEIPSIGSCLTTPVYPWKVRNDYEHLKTCIKYGDPVELQRYVNDNKLIEDVSYAGHEHFLKHHTVDVRFHEFMEYLHEVRGNKE